MNRRDPGLQPERTVLAWQRTSLSAVVTTALLLRVGLEHQQPFGLAAGICALVVAVLAWTGGRMVLRPVARRVVLKSAALVTCLAGGLVILFLLRV